MSCSTQSTENTSVFFPIWRSVDTLLCCKGGVHNNTPKNLNQIIAELQESSLRPNNILQNLYCHPEVLDIDFNFTLLVFLWNLFLLKKKKSLINPAYLMWGKYVNLRSQLYIQMFDVIYITTFIWYSSFRLMMDFCTEAETCCIRNI